MNTPTSVQEAGLQEIRDVARMMLANRQAERAAVLAAIAKAKGRLVDPNVITGVFSEEGVSLCDVLSVLEE